MSEEKIDALAAQLKEGMAEIVAESAVGAEMLAGLFEILDIDDENASSESDNTSGEEEEDEKKKKLKHLKKSHNRLKARKKQIKGVFTAVKELVEAHDGDSDATSGSDAEDEKEEEDGVDHTIAVLTSLKSKYKKLKGKKKGLKSDYMTAKQGGELLEAVRELIQTHEGDSDATSDSDAASEDEEDVDDTIKAVKSIRKKYKKLKGKKKGLKSDFMTAKQSEEVLEAVRELIQTHEGDSDATSESDAASEEDDPDETIKSLKSIRKKYKKLKGKKKGMKSDFLNAKQSEELLEAVKELVQTHEGDSDATSESDAASEDEADAEDTIKALKTIKKKYKKLKGNKKKFKSENKELKKKVHKLKKKLKKRKKHSGSDQSSSASDASDSD